MRPLIPNLWINDDRIDEAAEFYLRVLPDARVASSNDFGPGAGELAGKRMAVFLAVGAQTLALVNGAGTTFVPTEAVSLALPCDTQDEIDRLWAGLLADGGAPGPCGWLEDRFGFSWQVYPARLDEMMVDPDPARVERVVACFMAIDGRAFDLDELEAAYVGG